MAASHPLDPPGTAAPLTDALDAALDEGDEVALESLGSIEAAGRRDLALALSAIHGLHLAPVHDLGYRVELQHHPAISALKRRLERQFLRRLASAAGLAPVTDAVAGMRKVAAVDLVPEVYDWVAEEATLEQMRGFLSLEGGPDGGFDDLVAACQVGIGGEAKVELATNYWDEMGRGELREVHTELHRRMAETLALLSIDRRNQPLEALERSLVGTTLATNRALQPELVGALGLLELQAGPRCRRVVRGLQRLGASDDALAFYLEHAEADPRHGKDWLDHVVAPLADEFPEWAPRIVQGARWRSVANGRFFEVAASLASGAEELRDRSAGAAGSVSLDGRRTA